MDFMPIVCCLCLQIQAEKLAIFPEQRYLMFSCLYIFKTNAKLTYNSLTVDKLLPQSEKAPTGQHRHTIIICRLWSIESSQMRSASTSQRYVRYKYEWSRVVLRKSESRSFCILHIDIRAKLILVLLGTQGVKIFNNFQFFHFNNIINFCSCS